MGLVCWQPHPLETNISVNEASVTFAKLFEDTRERLSDSDFKGVIPCCLSAIIRHASKGVVYECEMLEMIQFLCIVHTCIKVPLSLCPGRTTVVCQRQTHREQK